MDKLFDRINVGKLFRQRLQARLMVIYLTLLIVTIGLIAVLAYNRGEVSLRQSVGDGLAQTAHTMNKSIARFIIDRYDDIQFLADSPVLRAKSTSLADKQAFLKSVQETYTWYNALYLIDTDGMIVAASDGAVGDMSSYDWFQRALNGEVVVTDVYFLFSARGVVITFAAPVIDLDGQQVGVLASQFAMPTLWDFINEEKGIGTSGFVMLIDQHGRIISYPDPAVIFDEASRFTPAVTLQGESGFIQDSTIDGVSRLYGFAPIQSLDDLLDKSWTVVTTVPTQEVFRPIEQLAIQILIMATILTVIVSLVTFLVTRNITHPIQRLASAAQAIGAGEISQEVEVTSRDEIGALAEAFNAMVAHLREMISSLEMHSAELAERARELEASQRVTFAASERTTPDALLELAVNLIRDQFHLYHVQVYLVDEEKQAAVLNKSTGYAGRRLLQSKHQIPLDQPALVTKAILEGQPGLVADISQDPNFLPNPILPHTRSELAVPLKLGPNVIGVLDAQDREAGRFSESTVALFQTMANQIAFLFENSDRLQNVSEQSETLTIFASQLRTAAEIARQLGTVLDPDRLLQQVVDMMQSRFGLYHAHIYVLETFLTMGKGHSPEERMCLTVRAGSGEVGRVLRERRHSIPLDSHQSLVARAARTQEMVVINDTNLLSDFMPNPLLPQTNSELAVPLVFGDKVLGVLDLQDDQADRFTQTELDTFTTLAGQIATALQTAGLFAQVQARFLVSQTLAGTQTEDDVLDAMVNAASSYPGARISIYTIDNDSLPDNGQEVTAIVRRDESFDSEIPPDLPIGTHLTSVQFTLLKLVSSGEAFISSNLLLDERVDARSRETAARQGVASMALLPIVAGDEFLGMITATSQREGYFDERKLHLYRSLAEQGAMALRTGQLFDETQRTAERLREVDRIKGEFLASMSHELRTPLNSILGYTEVMLMGIDGDLDPETQEDVQAIYQSGQHLLSLINDVLDVAKIEAGYLRLNIEEVFLAPLIETAQNNAAGLLTNKPGIEFVIEAEGAETYPSIQGDPTRLTQILNNLISNAIKFTDEGRVILRAYRDHPDWICLEVEDSGIGISEGDLTKIFDRFHQVDASESRRAGGTGLGLPITRHLVELHRGTIEVRTQVGEGSTFTVRLPVQVQEGEVEPEVEVEMEA